MKPTRVSADDMKNLATALFKKVEVHDAKDDCSKPTQFLMAWEVLPVHDKFMTAGNIDVEHSGESSPGQAMNVQESSEAPKITEKSTVQPKLEFGNPNREKRLIRRKEAREED